MRALLVAVLATLFVMPATGAQAAKPMAAETGIGWQLLENVQIDTPVEQQTDWPYPADRAQWTLNPLGMCAWDVDDHWAYLETSGVLAGGASAVLDQCMVSEPSTRYRTVNGTTGWWSWAHAFLTLSLSAPRPDLAVSVCYRPQGRCFEPRGRSDGKRWAWESCSHVVYADDDPAVTVVPGSQGGLGVPTTITVTVTNTSSRAVRDIAGRTGPGGCGDRSGVMVTDYPFTSYTS